MSKTLHTSEYDYFRRLLVAARKKAGLSQVEVSEKLGRPQSFVSKYESGERRLDVVEYIQICHALSIDPRDIIAELRARLRS